MGDLEMLTDSIKRGDRNEGNRLTQILIDSSADPERILAALTAAMDDVGRRFKANQIYVPEVLIAARAMKEATAVLEPILVEAGIGPDLTAVIGTVEGDLHDIGKNLVAMMWKGANIGVIDLGINVSAEVFVEACRKHKADVVGISALLTTTMQEMRHVTEAIRNGGNDGVKIVIGGAPITSAFADEIGADGYAPDAASAVDAVRCITTA